MPALADGSAPTPSLCAAGKAEAGVKGLGVSAGSAKKLLSKYGSIQAARQAFQRGELPAWSPAVRELLSGPTSGRLIANIAATSLSRDPDILPAETRSMVSSLRHALQTQALAADLWSNVAQPRSLADWPVLRQHAAAKLAWHVPYARLRWEEVGKTAMAVAEALAAHGVQTDARFATAEGLTVDLMVHSVQSRPAGEGLPVMLCAKCDLAQHDDVDVCMLTPNMLSRRMLAHVSLLKRVLRARRPVACFSASGPVHSIFGHTLDILQT